MQTSPIKKILVPLDLSPYADVATECACSIAKRHHAQVEGIVVLDLPEIMGQNTPFNAWMLPDAMKLEKERHENAKQRIADALKHFVQLCEPHAITHLEAEAQGVPADCILEAAALHDLLVMGLRTHFRPDTSGEPSDSLETILRSPSAPVLALPNDPKQDPEKWKKVVVAFDGSPNACRALKEFTRFAQPYHFDVVIVTSSKEKEHGEAVADSAAAYLRAHRITEVATVVTARGIHETIDEEFIDRADLVVAGIHSKKLLKDFFVGSLARKLIDYGHTPLFLN
jgi:nucleotide-binding universal stress UspA family protein